MWQRLALILGALVAILLVVIATRPAAFTVSRSTVVAAPATVIYDHIADFAEWKAWSPWEGLDPTMKKSYTGTPRTPGASYYWVGNDKVGEGRMTLLKAEAPSLVDIKLEFLKPFSAVNDTTFALTPSGANTLVVWTMTGNNSFMAKAAGMFMNMDKMIGGDFEKGLAQLKTVSEAAAAAVPPLAPATSPTPAPAPSAK